MRLLKCFYIFISNILHHTLDISQIARQARATTVVPKSQKRFSCGFIGKKTKYYHINIIIVYSLLTPPPHFKNLLAKLIKPFACLLSFFLNFLFKIIFCSPSNEPCSRSKPRSQLPSNDTHPLGINREFMIIIMYQLLYQ